MPEKERTFEKMVGRVRLLRASSATAPEYVKMRSSRILPIMCLLTVSLSLWVNAGSAAAQEVNDTIRDHVERHQMTGTLVLAETHIAGRD